MPWRAFLAVPLLSTLVSRALHCVSESLLFGSHFNVFSLFEKPSSKIRYSIRKIRLKVILSMSLIPIVSDGHICSGRKSRR